MGQSTKNFSTKSIDLLNVITPLHIQNINISGISMKLQAQKSVVQIPVFSNQYDIYKLDVMINPNIKCELILIVKRDPLNLRLGPLTLV